MRWRVLRPERRIADEAERHAVHGHGRRRPVLSHPEDPRKPVDDVWPAHLRVVDELRVHRVCGSTSLSASTHPMVASMSPIPIATAPCIAVNLEVR